MRPDVLIITSSFRALEITKFRKQTTLEKASLEVAPTTLATFFFRNRELMTFTFEIDLDNFKVDQRAKYQGQKVISFIQTDT